MTLDNILIFSEQVLHVCCTRGLISGNTWLILVSNSTENPDEYLGLCLILWLQLVQSYIY